MVRKMNAVMDDMERLLDLKESQGRLVSPQSAR
jgi:hypothetical protein